jgi:hypothetical protein
MSAASDPGQLIGVVPKTERAEVRVYRKLYRGRDTIDVRIWWVPAGQTEYVPSSKGVAFDATKADVLRNALELVR